MHAILEQSSPLHRLKQHLCFVCSIYGCSLEVRKEDGLQIGQVELFNTEVETVGLVLKDYEGEAIKPNGQSVEGWGNTSL